MESDKVLKKSLVIFMSFLLVLSMIPFGVFSSFGVKKAKAADSHIPKDTFTIKKIADGTHNGPGTETFINSKNGYRVADDTINDGVVASNDYVTFEFELFIAAGMDRTVKVNFNQSGNAFEMADFSNAVMSNSIIKGEWKDGSWVYDIRRGATGTLKGTFSIRAKDTRGEISTGNVITALLTNGNYKYVSKSDPVTVVSVPLADLTIDNSSTYNQHDTGGRFYIQPKMLHIDDYSKAGLTANGYWHTDVDVSSFPAGTTWTYNDRSISVVNGKLKNLRGSGEGVIAYKLPKEAIPSKDNPDSKEYIAFLEPYEDSFETGDQKNIKDPGSGEDKYYDTSKFEIGGHKAHAISGYPYRNNNYVADVWVYREEPVGDIWRYDVYRAKNSWHELFDEEYRHWDPRGYYKWYGQGTDWRPYVVASDHDMRSEITINGRALDGVSADRVVAGDAWNLRGVTGEYRGAHYDTTREVVVRSTKKDIMPSDFYKVEWRHVPEGKISLDDDLPGASKWIESNKAPNAEVNQYRITFTKDAFSTGKKDGEYVSVHVPIKTLNNYDPNKDMDKIIHSDGVCVINKKSVNNGVTGNDYNRVMSYDNVLQFPQKPQIQAGLKTKDERPIVTERNHKKTGTYTVHFETNDKVLSIPTVFNYTAVRTLTFDDAYDVSTFSLESLNGWRLKSQDKHSVVLEKKDFTFEDRRIGNVEFSIETIPGLNSKSSDQVEGSVIETIELQYPKVGIMESGIVTSSTSNSYSFDAIRDISSVIISDKRMAEIDDDFSYTVRVMANTSGFSQDIYMPYNGDKKYISMINKANNSNIDIDDNTGLDKNGIYDNYGRSKITGSYTIDTVKLSEYAVDTDVFFEKDGTKVQLPISKDGIVDVSKIKDIKLGNISDVKLTVSSNTTLSPKQGSGFTAQIKLKPVGNKADDVYVMWLGTTRKYKSNSILNKRMAWGDYCSIVQSSISGYVWNDENEDGYKNSSEYGLKGVAVVLQKADKDGKYEDIPGYEINTDNNGYYSFKRLHSSDDYRVVLKNIDRSSGKDEYVNSISGSIDKDAKDGELVLGYQNRFGVLEKTKETYSYPSRYKKYTDSKANIKLGTNEDLDEVNFGFYTGKHDLSLDVSKATVTQNGRSSEVEWDVTIKNNSKNPISGLKLNDRVSNKVLGINEKIGYEELQKHVNGKVTSIAGDYPLGRDDERDGFAIGTTEGMWKGTAHGGSHASYERISSNRIAHIGGSNGTIYQIASGGMRPFKSPEAEDFVNNQRDILIGNVPEENRDHNFNNPPVMGPDTYLSHARGYMISVWNSSDIENAPDLKFIGYKPFNLMNGGVYDYNKYVTWGRDARMGYLTKKIFRGITTEFKPMYGDNLEGIMLYGGKGVYIALSGDEYFKGGIGTSGNDATLISNKHIYYIKDSNYETDKIKDITGEPMAIAGETMSRGVLIATTDGYWNIDGSSSYSGLQAKKLNISISGKPLMMQSDNTIDGGVLIATTDGVWLMKSNDNIIKVSGITGDVVAMSGSEPGTKGSTIATTDGVWLVKPDGSIIKVNGIKGVPRDIKGKLPFSSSGGSFVMTTEGSWVIDENGKPIQKDPMGIYRNFVTKQSITPTSVTSEGEWQHRQYDLPRIEAGGSLTLRIQGNVYNEKEDFVVGNQAWVTSELTPRSGIKTSKVTGNGMPVGTPDVPILPTPKDMKPDGIYDTPTVGINKDIDHDSTIEDDLADQTPALIPALPPSIPPLLQDGSLSGIAWFDKNKDGIRDSSEECAPNVKVTVRNQEYPDIFYETETNSKGEWHFDKLAYGNYEVHYDVLNYSHNDKHFKATTYGGKTTTDSDIDSSGFVTKEVKVEDSKTVSGTCDAGLVELNGKLKVTKAAKYGKDEKDDSDIIYGTDLLTDKVSLSNLDSVTMDEKTGRVSDNDKFDYTQGYGFRVENLGSEALTNIMLSDKTIKGEKAVISSNLAYYEGDKFISRVTITDNVVTKDGKPLILKPGDKLLGSLHVGFTKENPEHTDELNVSGAIVSGDAIVGSVKDSDGLTTKYVERPARMLKINKYGVSNVDDKNKEKLEGVTFKLERVLNPYDDVKDYKFKSLGKYATDENGQLDVRLDAGKYKLTEVKAALGYNKPSDSGWFIDVSYDEAGNPKVKVASDASMPYIDKKDGEVKSEYWGSVDVYNYKLLSIPITGGKTLYLLIGGFGVVALGIFFRRKFAKTK